MYVGDSPINKPMPDGQSRLLRLPHRGTFRRVDWPLFALIVVFMVQVVVVGILAVATALADTDDWESTTR
jgi:hypothetical protein